MRIKAALKKTAALGAAIFLWGGIFAPPVGAEEVLMGTFWWEAEPFVGGQEYPQTSEEALRYLLDEARWVFSGMVYGFQLSYVPADSRRRIQTYYDLSLIEEIPWGHSDLRVISAWAERSRYCADLAFYLSGRAAAYRGIWLSNVYPVAGGRGEAPLYGGFGSRRLAMEEAIREAVHTYYRSLSAVRPREITGTVVLQEVPSIIIREGNYLSQVRVKLHLDLIPENP
jgi:hypothetical protein